ncbi:MAG TPA: heavy metal translocating P-type ATPase, partial [Ilumatobacteraceae bacterium]|nr:heavy metal translocating P-type ATPase [Ilumatobacteraceae bacterium]
SMATSLGWFDLDFWWELAALVTIMLLGHWQEMKAIGQAQNALAALAELIPDEAEVVRGEGVTETVPIDTLAVGDVVLVRAGGRVPVDGEIVDGEAELDESMITGESRPVEKREGDRVVAGTVSTDSSLRISVVAVGDDTALAGIQRMVADAQESSSRAQVLADRFAALLFYVAAGAALATFVAWAALGDVDSAVVKTVTVLVIACPHALGLAIPLVIAISTAVSARAGILVKDRLALERMRTIDAVLFDKTGTLTKGAHVVTGVAAADTVDEDRMVAIAGAVESDSEHPLARAITAEAARRGDVPAATDFRARTGRGVDAVVDGEQYSVGGPALLRELGAPVPGEVQRRTDEWVARGAAALYLFHGDGIIGAFALEDEVRPEARQAVDELKAMGIQVVMITGDAQQVADAVGAELGLDRVMAEVLPEDKDRAVSELQAQGLSVAMVGDGVNDAPALARADVGLAIGAGTDVAIESAGVVLASSDPRSVTGVVRLSRASYRKMVQNLAWAAGYNIVAIPLAAGVFAWAGLDLSPAVGAILMSLSTIVVALNAQLLRRVDLQLDPIAEEEVTSASLD